MICVSLIHLSLCTYDEGADNGTDDAETYRDAPVSLQLVGRPYQDEKVLQALEFIMDRVPGLKKNVEG
jgi:hypothetical protein